MSSFHCDSNNTTTQRNENYLGGERNSLVELMNFWFWTQDLLTSLLVSPGPARSPYLI